MLQVDYSREFMDATTKILKTHNVQVLQAAARNRREQRIVERFNRTLAERLFGAQYA